MSRAPILPRALASAFVVAVEAVTGRTRGRLAGGVLLAACLVAVGAAANVLVYPVGRFAHPASAVLFGAALAAIVLSARNGVRRDATLGP